MAIYACPAEVDMTQELLKLALEALETELSIDWTNNDEFNASAEKMHEAITAIKEALAQQEQEPQLTPSGIHKIGCVNHDCQHCKEMKDWEGIAADQAMTIALMKSEQQEPVACQYAVDVAMPEYRCIGICRHTTPPQRKSLTDKQILADETLRYYFGQNGGAGPVSKQGRKIVNAIEALHNIKETEK
jgi:hypothetical protein